MSTAKITPRPKYFIGSRDRTEYHAGDVVRTAIELRDFGPLNDGSNSWGDRGPKLPAGSIVTIHSRSAQHTMNGGGFVYSATAADGRTFHHLYSNGIA